MVGRQWWMKRQITDGREGERLRGREEWQPEEGSLPLRD